MAGITKRHLAGLAVGLAWMLIGYFYIPIPIPKMKTIADQFIYAFQWQTPVIVLLLWGIMQAMNSRGKAKAFDPLKMELYDDELVVRRNFITNTIEQMILHCGASLLLSTYLEVAQMKLIPVRVALFVVGRVAYLWGYLDNSEDRLARGFGLAMYLYFDVFAIMYCCYKLVVSLV